MSAEGVVPSAELTVQLVRPEVPMAVVVLYRTAGAVQVTTLGDVPERAVVDAMVAAAFELNETADLHVHDVESDGGLG